MPHLIFIIFLFAFGACVGSFLNVVAWRLPRGESLVTPPSRCPFCGHRLGMFDNIPVFGWIVLRGRCRYCFSPISGRYPAIEFLAGAIFVFYYIMFFIAQRGPCADEPVYLNLQQHWPIYFLYMIALSALLAASIIDLDNFFIPMEIPYLLLGIGVLYHATYGATVNGFFAPGALHLDPTGITGPLTLGAGVGLIISIILLNRGVLKPSFADGFPALEIDKMDEEELNRKSWFSRLVSRYVDAYRRKLTPEQQAVMEKFQSQAAERDRALMEKHASEATGPQPKELSPGEIRREMRHEMLFLLIPMSAAFIAVMLVLRVPAIESAWVKLITQRWANCLLASLFGAMIGAISIWLTRILATVALGREAMGLGDVHLMFGVGAIIGAGASVIAYFIAPFFGILVAIWMLITGKRREIPYGPYLSLATAFVMLFYCPIAEKLSPGMIGIVYFIRAKMGYQ